ncbi:hypothetical protein QZM26_19260, partial [Burkholderia multivorans]|nr:hypothetical protein [Burkholderia multivorans]
MRKVLMSLLMAGSLIAAGVGPALADDAASAAAASAPAASAPDASAAAAPAATASAAPDEKRYETDEEFHARVRNDLQTCIRQVRERTGI